MMAMIVIMDDGDEQDPINSDGQFSSLPVLKISISNSASVSASTLSSMILEHAEEGGDEVIVA